MSRGHTPGPWVVEWHYDGDNGVATGANINAADGSRLGNIYSCDGETCGGTFVGSRAEDARLIAAAPELLGRLEELVHAFSANGGFDIPEVSVDPRMRAAFVGARAAIAKATGAEVVS